MDHERDEGFLMGQVAGIIAVMSALVQALPPTARKRLLQQLHLQFESLIAAMRTTGATETKTEQEGAEWVRDLFLRQIDNANKKTTKPKTSSSGGDTSKPTPQDDNAQGSQHPHPTDLDIEF